jgi:hypothetical protein
VFKGSQAGPGIRLHVGQRQCRAGGR